MALPALAVFLLFAVIPLGGVLALSFTRWDGLGPIHPAGTANWRSVLSDPALPHSLWVTFEVMFYSWAVQTPISILLGVFMAGRHRYRAVLAVFYFIPFHSLIYQGAVRQIPQSLYEAAALDGAGRTRTFFSITLPQLKHTIITSSTLMVVGSLTFFDLIFVLTAGGPGDATRVLALDMYRRGFGANQMGPASVIAVILVLVGLAIALGLRRLGGNADESQLEGI
jgi:raffinose/stachyose/melibiose transport system permease protein